ncbi:MAG TPA: serine/threonine-protein kinase, partial [Gemmatimonadaceae bacterium]|nr:serine/threonine-protein kinase [Gemmatimonadaceae bacterium]
MTPSVLCSRCNATVAEGQRYCGNCGAEARSFPSEAALEAGVLQELVNALRRATLGEYEIREELGRGGMAYVFLAHEISLGRKVALKVLAPHLQLVPGMPTRFLREAQTAAGLEHPNIIPIYARRETPDVVFFTMRYVAGITLSALVRQVGPLPIPLVRSLLSDIGGALAFAHHHGVLHRDVKPGNVMVGRDGSVFVTDFGIAKQTAGAGLTVTGQLLGTPGYMSPEQCRGGDVSHASDQYSLGAMAFELLCGRPPFVGNNAIEIMAQQMTQPVPDLLSLRPDCPPELAHVVLRMLAKEPTARFPSLEEAMWTARAVPLSPGDPV